MPDHEESPRPTPYRRPAARVATPSVVPPGAAVRRFAIRGAIAPLAVWRPLLASIVTWPAPGQLAIERRVVRTRRGLDHELVVTVDTGGALLDVDGDLDALLRPLRRAGALRPVTAPAGGVDVAPVRAVLGGLGTAMPGPPSLWREVREDLSDAPVGTGLGIGAWTTAPIEDHEVAPELAGLAKATGFDVTRTAQRQLHGAVRTWSPEHVGPALLARVAAATGATDGVWVHPADADATRDATARLRAGLSAAPSVGVAEWQALPILLGDALSTARLTPTDHGAPVGAPYPGPLPREGAPVGRVLREDGSLRRLRMPWERRRLHALVCGRTGSGKSELLLRLIDDDLRAGRGVVVVDPHGDLVERVLGLVPPDRRDEVVLVDPHDARTAGIPALDPALPVRERLARLDDVLDDTHSLPGFTSRWREAGRLGLGALEALPDVDVTLAGLDAVIGDDAELRRDVIAAIPDPVLRRRMEATARLVWDRGTTRFRGLLNGAARNAFDHVPRWDLARTVADGGIVLAHLDPGMLGATDAGRLGRMLLRLVFNARLAAGSLERTGAPPVSVVVDEAQLLADGPALGAILAQGRKYGISLTLCTQTPSRLPGHLLTDVQVNAGLVAALSLRRPQAQAVADGRPDLVEQIATAPRHHAVLIDAEGDGVAPVLHPSRPLPHDADAARQRARANHGRTEAAAERADVERLRDDDPEREPADPMARFLARHRERAARDVARGTEPAARADTSNGGDRTSVDRNGTSAGRDGTSAGRDGASAGRDGASADPAGTGGQDATPPDASVAPGS